MEREAWRTIFKQKPKDMGKKFREKIVENFLNSLN